MIKGIFIIVFLTLTLTGQSQNLKIEEIMKEMNLLVLNPQVVVGL
jgi:hypothetical protein